MTFSLYPAIFKLSSKYNLSQNKLSMDTQQLTHHIQKHIMNVLLYQKTARFRDLRPPRVDTNLYSYHLKLLQKSGLIEKHETGYQLAARGLSYVDRVNADKFFVRQQPKIVTMVVIQNSSGDILLQKRTKQPYIDCWTLPYGKLHIDDISVHEAAQRELREKLQLEGPDPERAGECYIRVWHDGQILSSTLAHVFRLTYDDIATTDTIQWARPHKLAQYELAPAVEQIMTRTFFRDSQFFEEFDVEW